MWNPFKKNSFELPSSTIENEETVKNNQENTEGVLEMSTAEKEKTAEKLKNAEGVLAEISEYVEEKIENLPKTKRTLFELTKEFISKKETRAVFGLLLTAASFMPVVGGLAHFHRLVKTIETGKKVAETAKNIDNIKGAI